MRDLIHLKNAKSILTLESAFHKDGRSLNFKDLSILKSSSIIASKNKIIYVGDESEKIKNLEDRFSLEIDMNEFVITPEIVDSHTHLIFGGNRSYEYAMRLNGASYEDIANSGGGINHTSKSTNALSEEELFNDAVKKIIKINSYGVGTIEIKSGYGLNIEKEIQLSKIINRLKKHFYPKINIINTFMAAHAVPKIYNTSSEYIKKVCIPALEEVSTLGIIDFVDIFHEEGYFNESDVETLHQSCKRLNLKMRVHADEFVDNNGAAIASKLKFNSADHLLAISEDGIKALSNSNTVATLLPGTGYFLGKPQAPARRILDAGCKVAIASDFNPGSCHVDNVVLIANMAAPTYQMNQAELWSSITLNPAHSLGLKNQGAIKVGLKPRFSYFKVNSIDEISYSWTSNFSQRILEADQFFHESP